MHEVVDRDRRGLVVDFEARKRFQHDPLCVVLRLRFAIGNDAEAVEEFLESVELLVVGALPAALAFDEILEIGDAIVVADDMRFGVAEGRGARCRCGARTSAAASRFRSASSVWRPNSGSSSKNRMPRWASVISPGFKLLPPLTMAV